MMRSLPVGQRRENYPQIFPEFLGPLLALLTVLVVYSVCCLAYNLN
jgi:hypothetical protein